MPGRNQHVADRQPPKPRARNKGKGFLSPTLIGSFVAIFLAISTLWLMMSPAAPPDKSRSTSRDPKPKFEALNTKRVVSPVWLAEAMKRPFSAIEEIIRNYSEVTIVNTTEELAHQEETVLKLKELLELIKPPFPANFSGVLHKASRSCYDAQAAIVKEMLRLNIAGEVVTPMALHNYSSKWTYALLHELLAKDYWDLDYLDSRNVTVLMVTTKYRHMPIMKPLIAKGADPRFKQPGTGFTALHFAVTNRDSLSVHALLNFSGTYQPKSARANPNTRQADDQTPLALVADNEGRTPIALARLLGYTGIAEQLVQSLPKKLRSMHQAPAVPLNNGEPDAVADTAGHKLWSNNQTNARLAKDALAPEVIAATTVESGWRAGALHKDFSRPVNCPFPRVHISEITRDRFFKEHWDPLFPLIVTGVMETFNWALPETFKRESLLRDHRNLKCLGGRIPYGYVFGTSSALNTVEEFLSYMDEYHEATQTGKPDTGPANSILAPDYIFDIKVLKNFAGQYSLPESLRRNGTNLWQDYVHQFIWGPTFSGAPLHFHCDAYNMLVYGRKRWFLYPPATAIYTKLHPNAWLRTKVSKMKAEDKPYECVQLPGDLIYVPQRWVHATVNEAESIAIALEDMSAGAEC